MHRRRRSVTPAWWLFSMTLTNFNWLNRFVYIYNIYIYISCITVQLFSQSTPEKRIYPDLSFQMENDFAHRAPPSAVAKQTSAEGEEDYMPLANRQPRLLGILEMSPRHLRFKLAIWLIYELWSILMVNNH